MSACLFLGGDGLLLPAQKSSLLSRLLRIPPSRYRPHPYTLYELNPYWTSPSGRSRHNRFGFRGSDITTPKRPDSIRIVCMGESTTYCTGIEPDDATYPARLEAHLRMLRGNLDFEVINAGVGGYTSIENLLRYHFHIAPIAPDIVIYYYTHNDVHPRRMPTLSRDYREYSRSWFEPPFGGGIRGRLARRFALASGDIGNLVRRYDEFAGRRPSSNVTKNPPEAFRANMTALARLVLAGKTKMLFVNPPYRELAANEREDAAARNPVYRAVWEHRKVIVEIGAALGVPVYDLAQDMPYPDDPKAFPNEYYLDSVHVTEKGADLMGLHIARTVIKANLLPSP